MEPTGDVADWLEQGGTKEELLKRAEPYQPELDIVVGGAFLDRVLPPRGWLLASTFCRRFGSHLLATGGVGKTALRIAQYLSMASGKSLTGEKVYVRCRVLILCFEDGVVELERRMQACARHCGLTKEDLDGYLHYYAPTRKDGKLMTLDEKGRLVDGGLGELIERAIVKYDIDLVALDPFVKSHDVGENDNKAIDAVCEILSNLSDKYDIAVDSPHHTHKGP